MMHLKQFINLKSICDDHPRFLKGKTGLGERWIPSRSCGSKPAPPFLTPFTPKREILLCPHLAKNAARVAFPCSRHAFIAAPRLYPTFK